MLNLFQDLTEERRGQVKARSEMLKQVQHDRLFELLYRRMRQHS